MKVIITGATGMVGEGVLHECLHHKDIEEILVVNRRSLGLQHPKLKELIHANFFDLSAVENKFKGYDACFFCLGVSSVGKNEPEYFRLTYSLTMEFANVLSKQNPNMTFCYISGAGANSAEKGKSMWARIKGKTENDLQTLAFKRAYCFRPAFIRPTKGLKNTHKFYIYIDFLYPLFLLLFSKYVCTLKELSLAIINAARIGYPISVLEVRDIVKLSKQ